MRKKYILTMLCCLLVLSCELVDIIDSDNFNFWGYTIEMHLENSSDYDIENIVISLSNDPEIYVEQALLTEQQSIILQLDMEDAQKIDGAYTLSYSINNQQINKNIGYYTNGYPIDEKVEIEFDGSEIRNR